MFRGMTQIPLDKAGSLSDHTLKVLIATAPLDMREGDMYSSREKVSGRAAEGHPFLDRYNVKHRSHFPNSDRRGLES
jgi:hypothetical protein